jgi:hypothetical protein
LTGDDFKQIYYCLAFIQYYLSAAGNANHSDKGDSHGNKGEPPVLLSEYASGIVEHEDGDEAERDQQLHHQDAVNLANEALTDAFVRELKAGACQRVFDIIAHASVHIGIQSRSDKRSALNERYLLHYV